MTLSTTATRVSAAGNGATVTFPFSFKIWAASNLKVYWRTALGVETLKTLTTHYTIDIITYPNTGNVVFDVTAIPPSGTTVVIVRDMPLIQELDLIASGTFAAENVEIQLDKLAAEIQALRDLVSRTPQMPITSPSLDLVLPAPSATTANQVLGVNSGGTAWEMKTTSSSLTVSAFGATLVDDADAAEARTTLGLGTIATAAATDYLSAAAAAAAYQPLDADLTSIAALTTTAFGRGLLELADASAGRTALGLVIGTNVQAFDADLSTWATLTPSANAQSLVTAADYAAMRVLLGLVIGTNVQAYDADLTTWAAITPSANVQSFVGAADYSAMRTQLGLVIGTNVQAYDADLTTWAGLTPSANAQSLVTAADYAAMRALLDLEVGTDFLSIAAIAAAYQPLDSDLTSWAGVTRASGFDTFAATPSSANLRSLLTDEAGTGSAYFTGGALGTPASGTLTNATGLPLTGLVSDTTTALGIGTIELGHASDTTISRSAAGVLAVEGGVIPKENRQNTFTANQIIQKASANMSIWASSGDATHYVSAVSGSAATMRFTHYTGSAASDRWLFGKDATAESGANAGSDFACYAYDDSGNFLHTVFTVQRSTGCFRFGKEIRVGGDVGGQASHNSFTNVSDVTANSTGVGSIKFKGATSRDTSGFIKIYVGTTAYYVPIFSAITG